MATKIQVIEHNETVHEGEIAKFEPAKIIEELKQAQVESPHMVAIGDVLIDARSVKTVKRV
jgi:hypothetical protein